MENRIKVLFILPTLHAGGAERILSFLAKEFNTSKFESKLLIIGKESEAAYTIDKVNTIFLNKNRVLYGIPSLILFLVKYRPKIIMSSIGHLNIVLGLLSPFFINCRFIIREASVASVMSNFSKKNKIYDFLAKISFLKVDAVVCQSEDMANDFMELYKIPRNKIIIINNPITQIYTIKNRAPLNKKPNYITVGRLSKEKGHLRILEILSKLNHPFNYTIIGDGSEKENIFKKINELDLDKNISHISYSNDIIAQLKKHDVFLQGSYVEGFPNGILESCSVGTPVIAFNVPGGTREIIVHGKNGFLVDNEEDFLNYLTITKDWDPLQINSIVREKFDKKIILAKYETLFNNLL